MRVEGERPLSPYTRFGFSPQAILRPCGAPGNFIACIVVAGTLRSVTPRPPIRLAEPGSTCSVVTPPASAVAKPGSCGHTPCSAHTPEVTGSVASLPSWCACTAGLAYTPRCECTSMRPGVTQRPCASTTVAPSVASPAPTATILP